MAIAGLHNVSVFDSSYLGDSQRESVQRRRNDVGASTRASSVLQMWREIEDEHLVNHAQGGVSDRLLQTWSDNLSSYLPQVNASGYHDNDNSTVSDVTSVDESEYGQWSPGAVGSVSGHDYSSDLGEVERERVRQIFREWMNCGVRERSSSSSRRNNVSRREWLGETEQERVRIIREWVQMNSGRSDPRVQQGEERRAGVVGQIEQVLDGLVVNCNANSFENTRRGIRRLCGRQALLDMVKKAERERAIELQRLSQHRAVSQFAHRNRIQSLLKGRFLRNGRVVGDERPTTVAASEIGLLRKRHAVSDLREEFSLRLDPSVRTQLNSSSNTISDIDNSGSTSQQHESNSAQQVMNEPHGQIETNVEERDSHDTLEARTDLEGIIPEEISRQESDVQQPVCIASEPSDDAGQENNAGGSSSSSVETETGDCNRNNLLSIAEIPPQVDLGGTETDSLTQLNYSTYLERNAIENLNLHEFTPQEETRRQNEVSESEEMGFLGSRLDSNDSTNDDEEVIDERQDDSAAIEWLGNENEEGSVQVWNEDGDFQEAPQSWSVEPSNQEAVSIRRMDSFYFPDEDNVYSMELRELLSRRSVSTLLRSGFRESLDQLIRSYVERQTHSNLDWELQESADTPALMEQDLMQPRGDQNERQEPVINSSMMDSPTPPPSQHLWEQESHHYNLPQNDIHSGFGIEWDVINDLRIDMARLQQRMNKMQRMLEACMDMQLELQRSIRQEVSAALNRSVGSPGIRDDSLAKDRSRWDHVRKGTCCICCDSSIDSLLYRCGHMCTCTKCATELLQRGENCPMCRAPVLEVIRAYSIS